MFEKKVIEAMKEEIIELDKKLKQKETQLQEIEGRVEDTLKTIENNLNRVSQIGERIRPEDVIIELNKIQKKLEGK